MDTTRRRGFGRVSGIVLLAALCGCSTSLCAPKRSSEREVGGLKVELRAEGVRDVGAVALGAPHAFGIIVPTLEGYGYNLYLEVQDRPRILVYSSSRDASGKPFEDMPAPEVLEAAMGAAQLAVSPGKQHIAFRPGTGTTWTVFHMLPEGVPFDAPGSSSLGDGEAETLDLGKLGSPADIARACMKDAQKGYCRDHGLVWQAASEQPAGSGWEDLVISLWPDASQAHDILVRLVEDGPDDVKRKILARALSRIQDGRSAADVEKGCDLVERSMDEDAAASMDEALLDLWPQGYIHDLLMERFKRSNLVKRKVEPTGAFKARALEKAELEITSGKYVTYAGEVMLAAGDEEAAGRALVALLERWPTSDGAHKLIMENLDRAPEGFLAALEQKAQAHLDDPSPYLAKRARDALAAVHERGKPGS